MRIPDRIHIFGASAAGGLDMRSRALHDAWLATLPCPVVQLEGRRPVDAQLAQVEAAITAGLPGAGITKL